MDNQTNITHEQIPDVILMENLDPESPSYGAMALGTTGFMIADTRNATNTDWNWSTFGTGRGFNADLIKAGTLEAINIDGSVITGGTITGTSITGGNIYLENTGALSSYEELEYGYARLVLNRGSLSFVGEDRIRGEVGFQGSASYSYGGMSLKTVWTDYQQPYPYSYVGAATSTAVLFSVGHNANSQSATPTFSYEITNGGDLQMVHGGYRYTGYTGTIPSSSSIVVVNGIIVGRS